MARLSNASTASQTPAQMQKCCRTGRAIRGHDSVYAARRDGKPLPGDAHAANKFASPLMDERSEGF